MLHRDELAQLLRGSQRVGQVRNCRGRKEQSWEQICVSGGRGSTEQGLPAGSYLVLTVDLGPSVDQDLEDSQVAKPGRQEKRVHPKLGERTER